MGANFTPEFKNYSGQGAFRWWCQAVLPLVYDDSLSYMELLNKVVVYLNNTISDVAAMEDNVDALLNSYNQLQQYVNDYFDNLDVQDEINNKLDGLVEDGTMDELLEPFVTAQIPGLVESGLPGVVEEQIPSVVADQIGGAVSEQIDDVVAEQIPDYVKAWLDENVTPVGSAVVVDESLTVSGAAADAKVTGDKIDRINEKIGNIQHNTGETITPTSTTHGTVSGSVGDVISTGTQTAYWYGKYNITAESYYYVKTRLSTSLTYPYYVYFTNANDEILSTDIPTSGIEGYVEADEVYAPRHAVYMYVLSAGSSSYLGDAKPQEIISLQEQISDTDESLEILTENFDDFSEGAENNLASLNTDVLNLKNAVGDVTYIAGNSVNYDNDGLVAGVLNGDVGDTLTRSSAGLNSYQNAKYTLENKRNFYVKTTVSTNLTYIYYVFFTDDNDVIISKGGLKPEETTGEVVFNPVSAPSNATRMYIMCYTNSTDPVRYTERTEIRYSDVYSLQEQIDVLNSGKTCFVDANAVVYGEGTETSPFLSITEAIAKGYTNIVVASGEYAPFSINNVDVPISISLWEMPSAFVAATNREAPKIVITGEYQTGVVITNCREVYLSDVHVDGIVDDCFEFNNIDKLKCVRCFASNNEDGTSTETYMGFSITNCNCEFVECVAWNIDKDGFNIHKYGNSVFVDCVAHDCGDDGISHHDGCTGVIIGGEFYNCDKGGISTPTHGANVNVFNAYAHDNTRAGIHISSPDVEGVKCKLSGCVSKNNGTYDININGAYVVGWNNVYDTKSVATGSTFIEY